MWAGYSISYFTVNIALCFLFIFRFLSFISSYSLLFLGGSYCKTRIVKPASSIKIDYYYYAITINIKTLGSVVCAGSSQILYCEARMTLNLNFKWSAFRHSFRMQDIAFSLVS